MSGWVNEWMKEQINMWMNEWKNEKMNDWVSEFTNGNVKAVKMNDDTNSNRLYINLM